MSTTDHKRAFRAPTDNDGGFYVHPNSLDDIALGDGTPGLQRIVATNQASAIGPYILRGLVYNGATVTAGEAVFKSGGIVSVVATPLTGSGNYIYLSNAGALSMSSTLTKSDTSLLISYSVDNGTTWISTKQDSANVVFGHKDIDVVNATISVIDAPGAAAHSTGKETTIDTTNGVTTDLLNATTGKITTLTGDMSGASTYDITGLADLGTVTATTTGVLTASGGISSLPVPDANGEPARYDELKNASELVIPVMTGQASYGTYLGPAWTVGTGGPSVDYANIAGTCAGSAYFAQWHFMMPDDAKDGTQVTWTVIPNGRCDLPNGVANLFNASGVFVSTLFRGTPAFINKSSALSKGWSILIWGGSTNNSPYFAASIKFTYKRYS